MADDVEIKSTLYVSCNNISNAGVTSSKDMGEGINKDPTRVFFLSKYIEYCKRGHVGKMHKIFTEQMVKKANHLLKFLELGYKKPTIDDFKNIELYEQLSDTEKTKLHNHFKTHFNGENNTFFDLDFGLSHWDMDFATKRDYLGDKLFLKSYTPTTQIINPDTAEIDRISNRIKYLVEVSDGYNTKPDFNYKIETSNCKTTVHKQEQNNSNTLPVLLTIDRLSEIPVSCLYTAPEGTDVEKLKTKLGVGDVGDLVGDTYKSYQIYTPKFWVLKDDKFSFSSSPMTVKLGGENTKIIPVEKGSVINREIDFNLSYRDVAEHYISQDTLLSSFTFREHFNPSTNNMYSSQCHLHTMCDEELSYSKWESFVINDCVVDQYTYSSEEGDVTIIKSCNLNDIDKMEMTYSDLYTITYNINSNAELPSDYRSITQNDVNNSTCKFNPKFRLFARLTNSRDPFVPFEQLNLYPKEHDPDFIAFKDTKKYFFTSSIDVPIAFLKNGTFRSYNTSFPYSYIKTTATYDSSCMYSMVVDSSVFKEAKLTFIIPVDSTIGSYEHYDGSTLAYGSLSLESLWVSENSSRNHESEIISIFADMTNYKPVVSGSSPDFSLIKNRHYNIWSPIITFVQPSRIVANPHTVFVIGTNGYPFSYKNKDAGSIPLSQDTWYVQTPSVSGLINPTDVNYGNGIQINIPINAHRNTPTVIKFPIFSGQKYLIQDNWTGDYKFSDTIPTDWEPNNPDSDLYFSKSDEEYIPFKYSFYPEGTTDSKNKKIVSYVMNDKTYPFLEESGIIEDEIYSGYPYKIHKNVTHIIFEYSYYDSADDSSPNSYLINYTIAPAYERHGRDVFFNYKGIKDTRLDQYLSYTKTKHDYTQTLANQKASSNIGNHYNIYRAMLEKKYETVLSKLDFDPLQYAFKYGNDIRYSPKEKYPLGELATGASTIPLTYWKKDKNGDKTKVTRVSRFRIIPRVFPFKDSLYFYTHGTEIDPHANSDTFQNEESTWGGFKEISNREYLRIGRTLVSGETNPEPVVPYICLLTGVNIWANLMSKNNEAVKFSWMTDGEKYYLFEYFLLFLESSNGIKNIRKEIKKNIEEDKYKTYSCYIDVPMNLNVNYHVELRHHYKFSVSIEAIDPVSPCKYFSDSLKPKTYTPPTERYKIGIASESRFEIVEIKSKLKITVDVHEFGFKQRVTAILGDTDKGKYDDEPRGSNSNQENPLSQNNYSEAGFFPLNYGIVRYAPPYYKLQLAYQSIKFYQMPTSVQAEEKPNIWKKIGYSILAVIVCITSIVLSLVTLGAALPASGAMTAGAILAIIGTTLSIAGAVVTCFATLADIWGWLPSDVIDILNKVGMGLGAAGAAFSATGVAMNATGTVAIVASSMGAAAAFINVGVVAANMAIEINYKNEMEKLEEEAEDFQKALEVRLNTLDELSRILASNSSILPPRLTLAILGAKRIEDGVIEKPDAFFNRTKNIDQNLSRYLTMPFDTTENFVSMTLSLY